MNRETAMGSCTIHTHLPGCRMAHQPIPRVTQAWCKSNFEAFWDKDTWPPSSPDCNPMDFSVKSILERKVGVKNYPNMAALIKALKAAWEEIDSDTVRRKCKETKERFKTLVTNKGHYVE